MTPLSRTEGNVYIFCSTWELCACVNADTRQVFHTSTGVERQYVTTKGFKELANGSLMAYEQENIKQ